MPRQQIGSSGLLASAPLSTAFRPNDGRGGSGGTMGSFGSHEKTARIGAALVLGLALATTGCDGDDDEMDAGMEEMDAGEDEMDAGDDDMDAGGDDEDAGGDDEDAGGDEDAGEDPDGGDTVGGGAATSAQIQAVLDEPDGSGLTLTVDDAVVTYVKAGYGSAAEDGPGFFVQAEMMGPALYVNVDPSTLSPEPQVGDVIDFQVTEVGTVVGLKHAAAIDSWNVDGSGHSVSFLVQDATSVDLVTEIDDYTSELVTLTFDVAGDFSSCNAPFMCAQITSTGVATAASEFRFRAPRSVWEDHGIRNGCTVELGPTPVWRFFDDAQPSAWDAVDITSVSGCPAAATPEAGDLVVTEIGHSFSVSGDHDFVELTNPTSDTTYDVNGCSFGDGDPSSPDHEVDITGETLLLPGTRLVFSGGDAEVQDILMEFGLNEDDRWFLRCPSTSGAIVDEVNLDDTFPRDTSGAEVDDVSIQIGEDVLSGTDPDLANDVGSAWCFTDAANTYGTMGLIGTPGAPNEAMCPASCSAMASRLVINEINYDDDGSDEYEFVEIYNPTGSDIELTGLSIVLFNGADREENGRVDLSGTLAAGGFRVAGPSGSMVTTDFTLSSSPQNGAPDGVGILDTSSGTLIDFVTYEGAFSSMDLLDSGGSALTTIPSGMNVSIGTDPAASDMDSLARIIDACDTGMPGDDWMVATSMTPGSTNTP
ncbi:MAG TPA: lamin tail domain-containing protein [Sandaracinaceae bacterium LLY-WYZ-13_1]|nr:lamin tail domain-containing protein [Sandaracinaceae bacterium LLY-WYZ-13_1]